jgi:hypothetical protein
MYFPEPNCPFYRATVFSNYAEGNCPPADMQLPTLCMADGSSPSAAAAAAAAAGPVAPDTPGKPATPQIAAARAAAAAAADSSSSSSTAGDASTSGPYWSLMFEVTESSCKPVDQSQVKLGGTAGTW